MSFITTREQHCLDIDWYCIINGLPVHIASMGGFIPESFCERKSLRTIEDEVVNLPDICEVELNHQFIHAAVAEGYQYIQEFELENFIKDNFSEFPSFNYGENRPVEERLFAMSFIQKARKGFYSYARVNDTSVYRLVATPLISFDWRNSKINILTLQGQFDDFPNAIVLGL